MPAPLVFQFDFISPYAYVAWKRVHALAERHGRSLNVVPVLFAAMLDALGQKGPAEIPAKRLYTFKDAFRKAHRAGLALVPPPSHPFNPLVGLRVATALADDPASQRRAIDALYDATWATGRGIHTPELATAALTSAGLDGAALVARTNDAAVKERLRDATRVAIEGGTFGVPTLVCDGELFWGTDGLDFADAFLRGEDPLPKDLALLDRPPSAVRPRSK
jgi:2-hydroxychromene-2-carboxylate isomerase